MTVYFYKTDSGNAPVADLIENLSPQEQKYFYAILNRCNNSTVNILHRVKFFKKLKGSKLHELKINMPDKTYRILCFIKGDVLYLLHSFIKKTQKIQSRELKTALLRLKLLNKQLAFN